LKRSVPTREHKVVIRVIAFDTFIKVEDHKLLSPDQYTPGTVSIDHMPAKLMWFFCQDVPVSTSSKRLNTGCPPYI
jgi:hypothetical protein